MSTVTIVSILVLVFLVVFIIYGWCRGFLKIILTTLSLVATMVIAAFLLTPVSNFLAENTKIEQSIEKHVEKGLFGTEKKDSDKEDPDSKYDLTKIIAALRAAGLDVPDDMSEEQLLEIYNSLEGTGLIDEQLKKEIETEFLDQIRLPDLLKKALFDQEALSEQLKLGIENLKTYVVERISRVALKIMTYIGLVIAIFIIIRILLLVSKVLDNIPVIRGINRFFGAVVGFIEGALILWLICLFISLISQTDFGKQVVDVIYQSRFLTFLYEENLVLRLLDSFLTLF